MLMNSESRLDSPSASTLRVAVIGGGIGGLTMGLALRGHGITAEVFERTPELCEVGAAISLTANSLRLLDRLGLGESLEKASVEPTEAIHRGWRNDERISAHPIGLGNAYRKRFGAGYLGMHRAVLQQTLSQALSADRLHLGREAVQLAEIPDGLRVEFADGTHYDADIVVGADGLRSAVRSWVTDEEPPRYTRTSGFRGLVPVEAVPSLPDPGALQFWMGPGAHVLHLPIDGMINFLAVVDGPATWPSGTSTAPAAPGELAAHFAGWSPALVDLLTAMPQSDRWALFTQPPLRTWSRGRAVLLGDAVHAMLPHHGQGANQTIEDAAVLADCLAAAPSGQHTEAFTLYQRLRRARTRLIQRSSLDKSALLHLPDGPEATARNIALRDLDKQVCWIHGYDAQLTS
jgi:salicylate hydroxylase